MRQSCASARRFDISCWNASWTDFVWVVLNCMPFPGCPCTPVLSHCSSRSPWQTHRLLLQSPRTRISQLNTLSVFQRTLTATSTFFRLSLGKLGALARFLGLRVGLYKTRRRRKWWIWNLLPLRKAPPTASGRAASILLLLTALLHSGLVFGSRSDILNSCCALVWEVLSSEMDSATCLALD